MNKKKGLGRGLNVLLKQSQESQENLRALSIDALQPGKYQPRKLLSQEALQALMLSIQEQGVIQPIVVRSLGEGRYEIIAGERRYQATKALGLQTIPAIVRELSDENTALIALIENIQREELNPLETALGLQRLIQEFEMTHEALAQSLGKSRSHITNLLRLIALAKPVQALLLQGKLDMGHARALLSLEESQQIELANEIVKKGLSVRQAERLVEAAMLQPVSNPKPDGQLTQQEKTLSLCLGAKVAIQPMKKQGGKVVIEYQDFAKLEKFLAYVERYHQ